MKVYDTKQQLQGFPILRRGANWSQRTVQPTRHQRVPLSTVPSDQIENPQPKVTRQIYIPTCGVANWLTMVGVRKGTKHKSKIDQPETKTPGQKIDWGNPQSADCCSTFLMTTPNREGHFRPVWAIQTGEDASSSCQCTTQWSFSVSGSGRGCLNRLNESAMTFKWPGTWVILGKMW